MKRKKNPPDASLLSDTDLFEAAASWPQLNKLLPSLTRRQVACLILHELQSGAPKPNFIKRLNQRLSRLDADAHFGELTRVVDALKDGARLATILKTGLEWLFIEE